MSRELDRDLLRIQIQQRAEATREKRRAVEQERAKAAARRQLKVRPTVADEECKCRRLNPNKRRSPPSFQHLAMSSAVAGRRRRWLCGGTDISIRLCVRLSQHVHFRHAGYLRLRACRRPSPLHV